MSNEQGVKPFGIKDKVGYLFGDFGNDFTFVFASTYVMIFYSKVMGISPGLIGTMFLIARMIDAFTDIGLGRLIDATKPGKHGKYRTWILRMSGPVVIASFLMYQSSLANLSYNAKVVYMFITYLLWGSVFYTSINIPYGSMASVISAEPKDRSSLSVFRSMGGMIANIAISVIAPILIYTTDVNGNQIVNASKFTLVAGIFSISAFLCYMICFKLVTERVKPEVKSKEETESFIKSLGKVFKNRALIGIVASALLMLLAMLLNQGITNYVYADYFNNTKALSIAPLLSLPAMIIIAMFSTKIATKIGKKEMSYIGIGCAAILYIIIGVLHLTNVWVYVIATFFAIFGVYVYNMQSWALVTDVIDDIEVETNNRNDATVYGVYSFARKMGQAFAGGLVGWSLAFIGYQSAATVQTEAVKNSIYNIATIGTGCIYLLCALALYFLYPLGKAKVADNVKELENRRK